jgi:hypothetical protein
MAKKSKVIKFTKEHEDQLDGLIDETILPALEEDFGFGGDDDFEDEDDLDEKELASWKEKAINYLINRLKTAKERL